MKLDRSNLETNLPRKGFRKNPSGDHVYFHLERGGLETGVYTKVSHTKKHRDISGGILTAIRKQLHLEMNQQVADLVRCPMTREEYLAILIASGVIPPDDEAR
jgi:hypothetical protein